MELDAVPEPIRRRNSVEPRPILVVRRENYNLYHKEKEAIMRIYTESRAFSIDNTKPRDVVIDYNTHLTPDQICLMELLSNLEILNETYMVMDENSIRRVINPVIISRAYIRPALYLPECSQHIWLSDLEKEVLKMAKLKKKDLEKINI